jgi:hypothetical protein
MQDATQWTLKMESRPRKSEHDAKWMSGPKSEDTARRERSCRMSRQGRRRERQPDPVSLLQNCVVNGIDGYQN